MTEALIPSPAAAALLGIHPTTLRKWRMVGKGPVWYRVGKLAMYRPSDIETWLQAHKEDREPGVFDGMTPEDLVRAVRESVPVNDKEE